MKYLQKSLMIALVSILGMLFSVSNSWSQGTFKNGQENSSWGSYWDNGQLNYKGNYNNGKREGSYELYYRNGQLNKKMKWKYGFGVKK